MIWTVKSRSTQNRTANFFLLIFSVCFALVLLEGVFTLYYYFKDGSFISTQDKLEEETNQFVKDNNPKMPAADGKECLWADQFISHPYLSFVLHNMPPCGQAWVN